MIDRLCTFLFATILVTTLAGNAAVLAHPPGDHAHHGNDVATSELTGRVTSLETRVAEMPDNHAAKLKLARAQLDLARLTGRHEQFETAEQTFAALIDVPEYAADGHLGMAYAMLGCHQFREALRHARAASIGHAQPEHLALLGDVHLALGHDTEAEACYQLLAERETTLGSLSRLAIMHELRGEIDEATRHWELAIEAGGLLDQPPSSIAWCQTMLGELFMFDTGDFAQARTRFERAIELNADAHHASWRLAQIDLIQSKVDEAQRRLEGIAERSERPAFLITLGDVFLIRGDSSTARAWHEKAEHAMMHEVEDGDLGHARTLVQYWLNHDGDVNRAVELALHELRESRQDVEAYAVAARALTLAGRLDEAKQMFQHALHRRPRDPLLNWHAAALAEIMDRPDEASRLRSAAMETNPMNESIATVIGNR